RGCEAGGSQMLDHRLISRGLPAALSLLLALPAGAQSFRVQCPTSTITHPSLLGTTPLSNDVEPTYVGPTSLTRGTNGFLVPTAPVTGAIKCQQCAGGRGSSTRGDGTQTYFFCSAPPWGLPKLPGGLPGTDSPSELNTPFSGAPPLAPGDPARTAS